MKSLLLFAIVLMVGACHSDNAQPTELETKSAYSVLQSYELKWRNAPNSPGIVIAPSALGTRFDIVGFPISGRERGYVWVVLNPANPNDSRQFVRVPANVRFAVASADLRKIDQEIDLSPQARKVLSGPSN